MNRLRVQGSQCNDGGAPEMERRTRLDQNRRYHIQLAGLSQHNLPPCPERGGETDTLTAILRT
jgi:hypothetical protein